MKVTFCKDDKKYFTMAEAPIVQRIIREMKENDESASDTVYYAMTAMNIEDRYEVLKASAKISHNCHVWNYFDEDSETIDIWVDAIVKTYDTFYIIGFYVSDAWKVSNDNHKEIISNMYIRKFVEEIP